MDRESRSPLHDHSRRTVRRQLLPNQNHSAERTLDLPEIIDDYYLNLLDWSSSNIVAIALGNTVHLWDASNGSTFVLLNTDQENGPITSVSWAPNGQHIAIGMKSSIVEIWDTTVNQKLRTLQGGHRSRVGSLSLNNDILSTGGKDALIINNDVRIRSHIMQTNRGHHEEVCGLKWSGFGRQLVSGGIDNLLHIWDLAIASSNSPTQWIHRFERSRGYREGTSMESILGQFTRFCWW